MSVFRDFWQALYFDVKIQRNIIQQIPPNKARFLLSDISKNQTMYCMSRLRNGRHLTMDGNAFSIRSFYCVYGCLR